ncbi:solute carrier organic anion transporter family member 4C1-like isoform X2 [Trichogramma pretiosum]|uniref:solute carrier organic anion transporter family member 4C1-like isoform X2 n=1 Tax=Trichogramma pretiosum TaxID=7493 RepID=UPI0006C9D009|nr:solute carrier organic anion transporter family member 4C1-like isoform X2 [Trichogramma pretiosum]
MSMTKCGFCGIYPKCLQNWASTRGFIAVYAVLGTVQAMAFIYVVVCLTTLEKRFKIPTQTIGIILSGNEISQILSIVLIYYGGSGHRPRWISVGVALSSLSCFVLALPHAIYGPGQDALSLTMEYLNASLVENSDSNNGNNNKDSLVCSLQSNDNNKDSLLDHEQCNQTQLDDTSVVPRLIVFFSQFILGIGTTLYYVLGQPYIDDNTKKKNTPMLLGITFAFRTIGPALGFVLGYLCLNLYVDPSLHPVIEKTDPRWLGAWWLGWIILGAALALLAVLLAMFPQELKKSKSSSESPNGQALNEMEMPLQVQLNASTSGSISETREEKPTIKDFLISTKRILSNEMLMFNMFSVVFYVLSTLPFMNFIAKYLEIQFQMSPGGGTIITGPLTLFGMVLGFLISGAIIGKYKPAPRTLLFWNVMVGLCFFFGQIWIMFLTCETGGIQGIDFDSMQVNLTAPCNAACNCGNVKFSPVCHEASKTTFFSACHAGCRAVVNETTFSDCSCVTHLVEPPASGPNFWLANDHVTAGPCKHDCFSPYLLFSVVTMLMNIFGCSGRIGNVLINYRCVEMRDKSLALGFSLLVVSLFALIPGPIVFGAIMDSTCMVWDISCKSRGNCWVYHRDDFRFYVNVAAAALCLVGVFFDMRVCFLSKGIDLYGDEEEEEEGAEPNDQPSSRLST